MIINHAEVIIFITRTPPLSVNVKMQPSTNPYEPPKKSGEPNLLGPAKDRWLTGLFPMNIASCLSANIILLFMGQYLLVILVDLGSDADVDLPAFSMIAYSLVRHWFVVAVILLSFAIVTIYAWGKLRTGNQRRAFFYASLVSAIWILFTAVFAFAIISPLHFLAEKLAQ